LIALTSYEDRCYAVHASEESSLGEDAQEERPACQALRRLRAALRLAQEMGEGLGRGALLLGSVSGWAGLGRPRQTALPSLLKNFLKDTVLK
jgi:hypothetical protein